MLMPCPLIGSGKLFHNRNSGDGESSEFKKLKHHKLDYSSRSHSEAVRAAEGQTLPL